MKLWRATGCHIHCFLLYYVMCIGTSTEDWHWNKTGQTAWPVLSVTSHVLKLQSSPVQVMDKSQCEQKYLVSISKLQCVAHAPLGLGKVILCFRTRGIQETLIKTLSSALSLFVWILLSPFHHPFLSLFPLQKMSKGLRRPDVRC